MRKGLNIRESFTKFFVKHGHVAQASSSLVPHSDPTMLFTSAGMVQFKSRFLSKDKSQESPNVVTVQRCMRAGGKHNDLENVGHTPRHHTFFEMLGNFSFGNAGGYFKREAVHLAWTYLTREVKLDPDRLVVTVLEGDEETEKIWQKELGGSDKIIRMGPEDNFWSMGDEVGTPCGPCTEIHVKQPDGQLLEIWNVVFMQDQVGGGKLPFVSVDTGMGLERLASVLEKVPSNFDTAAFAPLLKSIDGRLLNPVSKGAATRVIADHARAAVFLAADGVVPSNTGRGHVMRRIIRRAARFAYLNGCHTPLLSTLTDEVELSTGNFYDKELFQPDQISHIKSLIEAEEKAFLTLLPFGSEYLSKHVTNDGHLSAEHIFKLNDAFGFPVDLTAQICDERKIKYDLNEVKTLQERHRETSRVSAKHVPVTLSTSGKYVGPDAKSLSLDATIVSIAPESGGDKWISIDPCPFYPEGGGQVGDCGWILLPKRNNLRIRVLDCQSVLNKGVMIKVEDSSDARTLTTGDKVVASVDEDHRRAVSANHTATHLLQSALKQVLGAHVRQAGSKVTATGLRFDYSDGGGGGVGGAHAEVAVDKLKAAVSNIVNSYARVPVSTTEMPLTKAKEIGAVGLFGEKYGETVRVVTCGSVSMELCGGTHVANCSEVLPFELLSIRSIGSGLKRVEAKAGPSAVAYLRRRSEALSAVSRLVQCEDDDMQVVQKLTRLAEDEREQSQKRKQKLESVEVKQNIVHDSRGVLISAFRGLGLEALKPRAHALRREVPDRLHVVLGETDDAQLLVVVALDKQTMQGKDAREILRQVVSAAGGGGGGGGNAEFACGVVKQFNWDKLTESLKRIF